MNIDPIIFTITIGSFSLSVHWYGVLVMTAVMVAVWLTAREIKRRGGNPDSVWDALPWLVIAGVIGARLWYVVNDILGGSTRYLDNPLNIINIPQGGLHFFGALLFGGAAFAIYAVREKLDIWMLLDSAAPYLLVGQAIARPANFINQELYGQPTDLPWGIPIDAQHRMAPWSNMELFPESTRFHPAFAYEIIWNLAAAGLLIWISRKFENRLRPGVLFFGWLVLAGIGRVIIEAFRPDQPRIPGTDLSFSRLVSFLMAVAGVLLILVRYNILRLSKRSSAAA